MTSDFEARSGMDRGQPGDQTSNSVPLGLTPPSDIFILLQEDNNCDKSRLDQSSQ